MKCRKDTSLLMSSNVSSSGVGGYCNHKFCQSCFRNDNISLVNKASLACNCPCCYAPFYGHILSFEEAVLIGEAATLCEQLSNQLSRNNISETDVIYINELFIMTIKNSNLLYY